MKIMLDDGAHMPVRAHSTDAGLDLYSRDERIIYRGQAEVFDTGVHVALPPNTYGKIESKSGLNVNYGVVSCGGVIDEGYTGSIKVKLYNLGDGQYRVRSGDKIAQLIIVPCLYEGCEVVDGFDETERGDNGFGSTGK